MSVHTVSSSMDAATLEALRGSIDKWEGIVAGTVENKGSENCPLCLKFHWEHSTNKDCNGCPVKARTGYLGCHNTPYDDYVEAEIEDISTRDELRNLAQAELDFLKSLLPPDARTDDEQVSK